MTFYRIFGKELRSSKSWNSGSRGAGIENSKKFRVGLDKDFLSVLTMISLYPIIFQENFHSLSFFISVCVLCIVNHGIPRTYQTSETDNRMVLGVRAGDLLLFYYIHTSGLSFP